MSNAAANDPGFAWANKLRPQAERLVEETLNSPEPLSEVDLRALVGELRLRQSELEKENEALRRVRGAAGDSSGKYNRLFDAMHMGCFVLDRGGQIWRQTRQPRKYWAWIVAVIDEEVVEGLRTAGRAFCFRGLPEPGLRMPMRTEWHVALLRNEETICVLVAGIAGGADDGAVSQCKLAMCDVNEVMKIDSAFGESEMLYRSIVENVNIGITYIDADHTIVKTNAAHADVRQGGRDVLRQEVLPGVRKEAASLPHCPGTRAMWTGKPSETESVGVRDDGSHFTADQGRAHVRTG